jgi:hypothetical protein
MLQILRTVNQGEKFGDGPSLWVGSVVNDQTAGLRIHQASGTLGKPAGGYNPRTPVLLSVKFSQCQLMSPSGNDVGRKITSITID